MPVYFLNHVSVHLANMQSIFITYYAVLIIHVKMQNNMKISEILTDCKVVQLNNCLKTHYKIVLRLCTFILPDIVLCTFDCYFAKLIY